MKNKTLIHFMFIAIISAPLLYAERPSQQSDNVMYSNNIRMTNVVKSQSEVHPETERQIKNTLRKTQANIMDVNEDGKKNCQDYAIIFYYYWTQTVDSTPGNCILVHNNRSEEFNHLFVEIMDPYTGKLVEIEPWTSYIEEYIMPLCWKPEAYDYTYNHYDETERFLIPVKKLPKDLEIEKPAQKPDGKGSANISNTPSRANIVKDQNEVSKETEFLISDTIKKIQASILDVNEDGKKNCVDHAILFYLVWSTYVDSTPGNCIIVHNYRSGVMNHLFVQVKDIKTGKFVEVEPWTAIPKDYIVTRCWKKETYDYRYNIYNETEKWLGQIKKRVLLLEVFR